MKNAYSPRPALVPVANLEEFFRDSVDAALATNHVTVDRDTAHYVVQLLTLFARADACYDPADGSARHRPLSLRGFGKSPSKPLLRYARSQSLSVSTATRRRRENGIS